MSSESLALVLVDGALRIRTEPPTSCNTRDGENTVDDGARELVVDYTRSLWMTFEPRLPLSTLSASLGPVRPRKLPGVDEQRDFQLLFVLPILPKPPTGIDRRPLTLSCSDHRLLLYITLVSKTIVTRAEEIGKGHRRHEQGGNGASRVPGSGPSSDSLPSLLTKPRNCVPQILLHRAEQTPSAEACQDQPALRTYCALQRMLTCDSPLSPLSPGRPGCFRS